MVQEEYLDQLPTVHLYISVDQTTDLVCEREDVCLVITMEESDISLDPL